MQIPDDENGKVLLGMLKGGDTLTQPRIIDYCHVFPSRALALEFVKAITEKEYEVCISYYEDERWQVIVKKHMIPEYKEVTRIEAELARLADVNGGAADGWGCMRTIQK